MAVELSTAAVFHLMRVSEYGCGDSHERFFVKLTDKRKHQPLEYADWDKVITGINNKIQHVKTSLSKGPVQHGKLNLCSEAAQHCLYMKDIWRNDISHTRQPYSQAEAIVVFERVRDFMQFLERAITVRQKRKNWRKTKEEIQEDDILAALLKVKPTADMPRPGQLTKSKGKEKQNDNGNRRSNSWT